MHRDGIGCRGIARAPRIEVQQLLDLRTERDRHFVAFVPDDLRLAYKGSTTDCRLDQPCTCK